MPFTFVFNGSFFDLEHLFSTLTSFTQRGTAGKLFVSGRLLTIQSVKLAPVATGPGPAGGASSPSSVLSGTISATAYVLPAGQATPAGAATPSGSGPTPASASGTPSSPAPPAVVTR
jgi:hypothetical protein